VAEAQRSNILFIMADQHRHDYMKCAGAEFMRTPNLDSLAARGVRFTQCCSNAPVCTPARIGLASGLQPSRLGSLDNGSFLPASVTTYYQRLRDAGYRTGCVGKLDLAKPDNYNGRDGDRPCVFGWGFTHPEEVEGKMHAGVSPTPLGPYGLMLEKKGLYAKFHADYVARRKQGWRIGAAHDSVLATEDFADSYIGRRATEWIENVADDFPWHFFVSFVGPHDPFDPPTEYADRYRNAPMPPPISDEMTGKPRWVAERREPGTAEQVTETRRQYCASTELIDTEIGRILAALEKRGMSGNTYVFYASDHGEMLGDHGMYHKSCAYESALRVPLLAAGPGIAGGRSSAALVELADINPTICELAGLSRQENIDALSFAPVLRGEGDAHRTETVAALRGFRCVRTERYKYVENGNDVSELYDLVEDPDEMTNIAAGEPERCRELHGLMLERFREGKWKR
jgi:arylsulfatase A-like enzyme